SLDLGTFVLPAAYTGATGFLGAGAVAKLDSSNGFVMKIAGVNFMPTGGGAIDNTIKGGQDVVGGNLTIQDLVLANPRLLSIDASGVMTGMADLYFTANSRSSNMQLKTRFLGTLVLTEDPDLDQFTSCHASAGVGFKAMCEGMGCEWKAVSDDCKCPRPVIEGCPPYYVPIGFLPSGQLDCRLLGSGECPPGFGLKAIDIETSICVPIETFVPSPPYSYSWNVSNGACNGGTGFLFQIVNGCDEFPTNRSVDVAYCSMSPMPPPTSCGAPSCPEQVLDWNVGGNACRTLFPATPASSSSPLVSDMVNDPGSGAAQFNCDAGGVWSAVPQAGATCVTGTNCPVASLAWTVGGNTCSATFGGIGETYISPVISDVTAPLTGSASFRCNAGGVWAALPQAGATCN
ncbi:MAG: hypothetical protein KDD38_06250, partial [Bdellovibrionales bacterium]|nr:hypothetical protein [Bdellovibrionales bacterium]